MSGAGSGKNTFLSDWKSFSQKAVQDMPLPNLVGQFRGGAGKNNMENLTNFGKSLQGSIASGFNAASVVAQGVDLQGVTSTLSSVASSTSNELLNFGKELQRDANDAALNMASGANQVGSFVSVGANQAQINHMIAQERLIFSASYVASLLATLYCSVVMHSYILTIVSSVLQLVALVYYQVSYFPMGAQGLKVVGQMGYHIAKPFVYGAGRAIGLIKPKTFLPL